jgi:uncharacterized membrane protein YbjE (DUF340 family)
MLKIVAIMLGGICLGFLFRQKNMKWIQHIITLLIWLLLFLLGIEVGYNKRIIAGLQTLGLEALILTIGGIMGSVVLAWLLWRWASKTKEESRS